MSINFNVSNNIFGNFFSDHSKGGKITEIVDGIQVEADNKLSELDKFIVYVDPTLMSNVKITNIQASGLKADAEKIMEAFKLKAENTVKSRMIQQSQERFNTIESVLDFVNKNEQLIELMSRDGSFRLKVFDKIHQLSCVADATENTMNAAERMFSRFQKPSARAPWKSQAERARKTLKELRDKFDGSLTRDEMQSLFRKSKRWSGAEHVRIVTNLCRIAVDVTEFDLGVFKETGKSTSRLSAFEQALFGCWHGLYKRGHFEDRFNKSNGCMYNDFKDRFRVLYSILHDAWFDKHPAFREASLRAIFEHSTPDEICKFLDAFSEENNSQGDFLQRVEREKQMLRCLPKHKGLELLDYSIHDGIKLVLAALYFVESVKSQNPAGLLKAKGAIRQYEWREKTRIELREQLKKLPFDMLPVPAGDISPAQGRIFNLLENYLTSDELDIFRSNYEFLSCTPAHQEASIAQAAGQAESETPAPLHETPAQECGQVEKGPEEFPLKSMSDEELFELMQSMESDEIAKEELQTAASEAFLFGAISKTPSQWNIEELEERLSKLNISTEPQSVTCESIEDLEARLLKLALPGSTNSAPVT